MTRWTLLLVSSLLFSGAAAAPRNLTAQSWNSERTRDLVLRATQRRALQLADSGLVSYTASARGYLTFLAQLGEGFIIPPKVVKADELALEVYWRAPDHSKQWIVGRRDTLLLPTDIQYHRDHLGIVQNNFPEIIRLGDGDEVQDVPHPLSAPGLSAYDFAISDSLLLSIPGREISVYEVKVRPRDEQSAAAVGALYISRDDFQVVRMAFSFTRSALRDRQLEDVSIILENSLIEGRFWLPRRQEIEIRRTGSWMDFPARGIIRGRWEIRDYTVNSGDTVALSAPGPEITLAPAERRARHTWPAQPIVELLPEDVKLATNDDVRRVQDEARQLVEEEALRRGRGALPAARRVSDIVAVNRTEGISLGAGARALVGGGIDFAARLRYGVDDRRFKGSLAASLRRAGGLVVSLRGFDEHRIIEDVQEMSRLSSSVASQEFGSDYTDPISVRGGELGIGWGSADRATWRFAAAFERHGELEVRSSPSRGRYAAALPATAIEGPRVSLQLLRSEAAAADRRLLVSYRAEARAMSARSLNDAVSDTRFWRFHGRLTIEKAGPGGGRSRTPTMLDLAGGASASTRGLPLQEHFFLGGPVSAPGYGFHELRGAGFTSARLETGIPIGFPPIPLGRFGRVPGAATLRPFVGSVWISGTEGASARPYAGAGLVALFDLVRIDVARGLRDGRWRITADVTRDFWPIL
ncbi:MAG: hypothetical protein ACT4OZ_13230 [Gemmatimonadota bacterium]